MRNLKSKIESMIENEREKFANDFTVSQYNRGWNRAIHNVIRIINEEINHEKNKPIETTITWYKCSEKMPEENKPVLIKYTALNPIENDCVQIIDVIHTKKLIGNCFIELNGAGNYFPYAEMWAELPDFSELK